MLKPTPEKLLVEIIEIGDHRAQEAAKRIPGFQVPPPEYQGVPDLGRIYAIGSDVVIDAKVDDTIVFEEFKPKGFHWDDKKLFALLPEQVLAVVLEPAQ